MSELTEEQIKDLMDYHKSPGDGWTWYSICSAHQIAQESCNTCMAGHWVNDEERARDHELYEKDYDAWHKKHNAPDSESKTFLKRIFPNLK